MEKDRTIIQNFIDEVFKEESDLCTSDNKEDYNRGWADCYNYLMSSCYRKLFSIIKSGPTSNS